jgi:hypothetical protein
VQKDSGVPDNIQFVIEDIASGLSFPDGYFDVVHARFIVAGVPNVLLTDHRFETGHESFRSWSG